MKKPLISLLISLTISTFPGCDSRTDEVDLEQQQWQYLYLQTFEYDVTAACTAWQDISYACYQKAYEATPELQLIKDTIEIQYNLSVQVSALYVRGIQQTTAAEQGALALLGLDGASIPGMIETIYEVTVPAPTGQADLCAQSPLECPYTISEICQVLPAAAAFSEIGDKTQTDGAKLCSFQCNRAYWTRQMDGGLCETSFLELFAGQAEDTPYKDCLEECLVRGTLLPPY